MQTVAGEHTMNAVWGGGNESTGNIFVTGGIRVRYAWMVQIRRFFFRRARPPVPVLEYIKQSHVLHLHVQDRDQCLLHATMAGADKRVTVRSLDLNMKIRYSISCSSTVNAIAGSQDGNVLAYGLRSGCVASRAHLQPYACAHVCAHAYTRALQPTHHSCVHMHRHDSAHVSACVHTRAYTHTHHTHHTQTCVFV